MAEPKPKDLGEKPSSELTAGPSSESKPATENAEAMTISDSDSDSKSEYYSDTDSTDTNMDVDVDTDDSDCLPLQVYVNACQLTK